MRKLFYVALCVCCCQLYAKEESGSFQYSFIKALMAGVFEGDITIDEVLKKGDFGIGAINDIDGEMVIIDGVCYSFAKDARLVQAKPSAKVPFTRVCFFSPKQQVDVAQLQDYRDLDTFIQSKVDSKNIAYAIKIIGTFSQVKARTLVKTKKPYPPLLTAMEKQFVFNRKDAVGTAVGYWTPSYWEEVCIPGLHLHWIDKDKRYGGHVLDLGIQKAVIYIQPITKMEYQLPETEAFMNADLNYTQEQVKQAEGSSKAPYVSK